MNSGIVLKRTASGYNVFVQSNEIDQGTFKTSYIYLGKTTAKSATYGDVFALTIQ